jgi:hypothetical protein
VTDLSPEIIEGLDNADIQLIRRYASELHEATAALRDTPLPPQEYERQEELRRKMGLKIGDAINAIRNQVEDFEAVMRELRSLKGWLSADRDVMQSKKIEGFVREKEERMTSYHPQQ